MKEARVQSPSYHLPSDSVGRIMVSAVPTVSPEATIGDIEKMLLQKTAKMESIDYVYIVDAQRKLLGVLSVKEIFRQQKSVPVAAVMRKDLITVRSHTDQERAAHLALRHNIKAVPVVDKNGLFLGVVLNDAVLRTLYGETSEDILRLAGIKRAESAYDNVLKIPILTSLKHRLPWLLLGTAGGLLIAGIIGQFERTLEQNILLASFIPLVVYIADAVGTQMEAFIIRDLAVHETLNFPQYLVRQLIVILLIGFVVGGVLFAASALLYGNATIGLVVGASLLITTLSSVFTGLLIPYIFSRFRFDPANASGPIATIIQDAMSVTIYFTVASWLL